MRALTFLWTRSMVNGIRRSLTSGRRLIGLLFFAGYYFWLLRPMWAAGPGANPTDQASRNLLRDLQLPPIQVLETLVFLGFAGVSLLLGFSMLSYRGGFRPADVDVLFPTPVSPKIVMMFRLVRDTLLTLIFPVVMAILFGRQISGPALEIFRSLPNPDAAPYVSRLASLSWLLLSMAGVSVGYAVSLYLNRADGSTDRLRKGVQWSMGLTAIALAGAVIAFFAQGAGWSEWMAVGNSIPARAVFFLATGASWLTMGPLAGQWGQTAAGAALLIGTITLALALALRQSAFFYEEAALNAEQMHQARTRQAQGNVYSAMAAVAQQGKVKTGKPKWLERWRPSGTKALVWKEAVLLWRAYRTLIAILVPVGAAMMVGVVMMPDRMQRLWGMALLVQLLTTMMGVSLLANTGYQELLKRVDLQKPLPFSPARTLFAEIWGKALLGIVSSWAGVLVLLVARPDLRTFAVACFFLMPTLAALLSAVFAVLTLLLPDQDDPTQRGFRSLMSILGLVVFVGPSGALFAVLVGLAHLPPPVAAIPVMIMNLVMAGVAAIIAGQLYVSYNPND